MMKSHRYFFWALILVALSFLFARPATAADIDAKLADSDNTSSFQVKDSADNVLMQVQSGGNVGIGTTTSPEQKLDINGNVQITGTNGKLVFPASHYDAKIELFKNGDEKIGTGENQLKLIAGTGITDNIAFFGATEVMRVMTGTGNVGIGSAGNDPAANLEVVNDFYVSSTNAAANDGDLFRVQSDGKVGIGTQAPNTTLHISGSFGLGYHQVDFSSGQFPNYSVADNDTIIGINPLEQSATITLPAATAENSGRIITIKDETGNAGGTYNVEIVPADSQSIDQYTSSNSGYLLSWGFVRIYSNGSNWHIIGGELGQY
jgi:hypothetical protein